MDVVACRIPVTNSERQDLEAIARPGKRHARAQRAVEDAWAEWGRSRGRQYGSRQDRLHSDSCNLISIQPNRPGSCQRAYVANSDACCCLFSLSDTTSKGKTISAWNSLSSRGDAFMLRPFLAATS